MSDNREGTWSTDGVTTVHYFNDSEGQTFVNCHCYHLTAFAVLADVAGGVNVSPDIEMREFLKQAQICIEHVLCLCAV